MFNHYYVFQTRGDYEYVIQDGLTFDQACEMVDRAALYVMKNHPKGSITFDQARESTGLAINSYN
jgi:hypothetical protein